MSIKAQYKERDIEHLDEVGGYYCLHVDSMTREALHSKSDIAAELAYRDCEIVILRDALSQALDEIELLRSKNTSLTNLLNDPQHVNAMPGGHGCCDICDTGGCCKAEEPEFNDSVTSPQWED